MSSGHLVLVVDDDSSLRDIMQMVLVDEGYEVMVAADGEIALRLVQQRRPAVILLDVNMPVLDGPGFFRAYRQLPGPHAPVIVMTAGKSAARVAAEIGAEDFLSKPYNLEDVFAKVAQSVASSEGRVASSE